MGWDPLADKLHQPVFDNNYGNIVICFQIAYGFGLLFAGRMIDKLGTKTGYALAILIWGLSSMGHSLVTSVAGFCIARIFLGLGESGNFPAAIKAVTEWFPTRERAKATGLFNSGSNASALIAPALVAFVTASYGWQAAFLTTGSMGMLWLVLWLLFPYNRLRRGSTQTQANLSADFASEAARRRAALLRHLRRPRPLRLRHRQGPHRRRLVVLPLLPPQVPQRNYGLASSTPSGTSSPSTWSRPSAPSSAARSPACCMKPRLLRQRRPQDRHALCALCVLPVVFVPHMSQLFPSQRLARHPAHRARRRRPPGLVRQPLLHPRRHVPLHRRLHRRRHRRSRGRVGGAAFTWIVKRNLSLHQLLVFAMAAGAYVVALAIFQLLVPRLGASGRPVPPNRLSLAKRARAAAC